MANIARKIGRHHLAYYRGWLQGLDLRLLADRYLETGLDLRLAKSTLVWLRDTVSQAALRHGRRGEARLLRAQLISSSVQKDSRHLPSLDEFQASADPEGFYREEELIGLYLEAFPEMRDKRTRQRQRLIARQLAALVWVEQLLVTEPVPEDPVSAWFDQPVAERLQVAGIKNIESLIALIHRQGYRWWVSVPKLGEKGAARIVAWLRGYETSLGPLPPHSLAPIRNQPTPLLIAQRQRETAIVPIEVFELPVSLSGNTGTNRHPGSQRIDANNDLEAIRAWLSTRSGSPHTERTYRKEAERLLLWAVIERSKSLSDLDVEDCAAYRDWLAGLGRTASEIWHYRVPQHDWIGKRNTPRFSHDWRPFEGPLAAASIRQALAIVSGLFEWLVRVQYCAFNPWDAVGRKLAPQEAAPADLELTRVFSEGQWQFLNRHMEALPDCPQSTRLRFAVSFAYATGLRLSELVEANIGCLYTMPLRDTLGVRWMLKVRGKGGKWRTVPFPPNALQALIGYLTDRGLPSDPLANAPQTPLIARLTENAAVSGSSLYKALKALFQGVGTRLRSDGRIQEAKDFEAASVHWLRHTRGSHLGLAGVPPNLIQKLLGHANLATTSIYTESDDERVWLAMADQEAKDVD